jgi:glucose/mannose-6-phosphate isomerase
MNLDDTARFARLDREKLIIHINSLPDSFEAGWAAGQRLPLPGSEKPRQALLGGMGSLAAVAEALAAYLSPSLTTPLTVVRGYDLPAWARGEETLFIAASHTGETEETLALFDQAAARGCRLLALTAGGELALSAKRSATPLWQIHHPGPSSLAAGEAFALLLALFARLGLAADQEAAVRSAAAALRQQQETLRPESPTAQNPAKRMAGQLMGRWVTVFGGDLLAPAARRWKMQINQMAKSWAQFESIPEADHNALGAVMQPQEHLPRLAAVFLRSSLEHPRNRLRLEATRKVLMLEGIATDVITAAGDTRLAQQWTALHYGDYTAYYLAMAYGVNPSPAPVLQEFKEGMRSLSD